MSSSRKVRHLVMWVAGTDRSVDDPVEIDAVLSSATATMTDDEGIVWATHDLDRESVCFSLMVEATAENGDDGLAEARRRARSSLHRCLADAGLTDHPARLDDTPSPGVLLRLDPGPLSLRAMQAAMPAHERLN